MLDYEDKILLKIKRDYSDKEKFNLLIKKLKEVEFENGVLKSEIGELKDNISKNEKNLKKRLVELERCITNKNREIGLWKSKVCDDAYKRNMVEKDLLNSKCTELKEN